MPVQKTINRSVVINADVSRVWEVLTTPEWMEVWISDQDIKVFSDWKEGGALIFKGTWHGMDYLDKGIIRRFERESVFHYAHFSGLSGLPELPGNYSEIKFQLLHEAGRTRLSLTQSNFATEEIYAHFNFYWMVTLEIMKKLMEEKLPSN